jgi:heme-degrading monooxygenase HmoA
MYEDIESKGSYVILSQWESKEAYGKFLNSPEFANAVAWGKAEILRSRPKHKVFNED